jgi:hypothetical protein
MMKPNFDHPCKDVCGGWRQGFEQGQAAALLESNISSLAKSNIVEEECNQLKARVEKLEAALMLARPFVEATNSIVVGQKKAYLAIRDALADKGDEK